MLSPLRMAGRAWEFNALWSYCTGTNILSFPLYIHTHTHPGNCTDKKAGTADLLGAVQGAKCCTRSNLWNILIIGMQDFNYLICSNSWNEWILTILIVQTGNIYSVLFPLHNLSFSCCQLLTPGNLQSTLTERNHCHLSVTPFHR